MRDSLWCLVLACASAGATPLAAVAAEHQPPPAVDSIASLRQKVRDGYADVRGLSIYCLVVANEANSDGPTIFMGELGFRFERSQRKIAAGTEGDVSLLVRDREYFLYLWDDENDAPIYFHERLPRAISWKDVSNAAKAIREECRGTAPCTAASFPMFVWPLLEDGAERLLPDDAVFLNADEADAQCILGVGHPDTELFIGPVRESAKLDPRRNPICVRTRNGSSTWLLAFDRDSGMLTAAIGEVARESVLGVPGNRVSLVMKGLSTPNEHGKGGEGGGLPLELPKNARTISRRQLKAEYHKQLLEIHGVSEIADAAEAFAEELTTARADEARIAAKLMELRASPATSPNDRIEEHQRQLSAAKGWIVEYEHRLNLAQTLLAELRETSASKRSAADDSRRMGARWRATDRSRKRFLPIQRIRVRR